MESGFLSQLFDVVGNPVGIVGLISGLFIAFRARRSPRLAWLLVALCCFAASLSVFQDQYNPIPPPLVFPLQQIRAAGRPLAILLLALLLGLAFTLPRPKSWRQTFFPPAIWALVTIQVLIFLKVLASGSVSFAFLSILTFLGVVLMVRLGPAAWLQNNRQFHFAIWAIATVGVIFMGVNGYQALFDAYPITFVHGAFLGTTGNPQHAATLLASTIPCLLFLSQVQTQKLWTLFWAIAIICTFVALFLTGSRTGAIMGILSLGLFFRHNQKQFIRAAFFGGIVLVFLLPVLSQLQDSVNVSSLTGQLFNTDNTRNLVWAALWKNFNAYPFFGVPLSGDRFSGYGENSWLAIASTLGIVGLIPLFFFGLNSIQILLKLNHIATRSSAYALPSNTVIAGLSALFIGSIFEAFLLGTLTFPLMVLLIYLTLGQYLIDIHNDAETAWQQQQVSSVVSIAHKQAQRQL